VEKSKIHLANNSNRQSVLECIAKKITKLDLGHPVRVAIDGVDAAGKTMLANEMVIRLNDLGKKTIRSSIDFFHNPRVIRYKRGEHSPLGYYLDSFQYQTILNDLLIPLGPGGSLLYRTKVYDIKIERRIDSQIQVAQRDAILLFDGIFLLRPELIKHWDFKIFVDVDFETSVQRALDRDTNPKVSKSDSDALRKRYYQRYIPGQRHYFMKANPKDNADIILDNTRFSDLRLIKG
jgi:uridine kinase